MSTVIVAGFVHAGVVHHVAKIVVDTVITIAVVCFGAGSILGFMVGRISKRRTRNA